MSLDPRSYRWQIRAHTRHEDSPQDRFGAPLWTETDDSVRKVPLPWRVSTATSIADDIAEKDRLSVAIGIVPIPGSNVARFLEWIGFKAPRFAAQYFVSAAPSAPSLSLVTNVRLGDSRHIYDGPNRSDKSELIEREYLRVFKPEGGAR